MAVAFKYTLDKSPKKFRCPQCGKKTFVLFIDNQSGDFAPDVFGRCDREVKCGYFARPDNERVIVAPRARQITPPSYVSIKELKTTFHNIHLSNLYVFLAQHLGHLQTTRIFSEYLIGSDQTNSTTVHWTVFWQVDINGDVRSAKMIRYNPDGRRDKAHSATWWHRVHQDRYPDFNLVQCFFGEHLLKLNPAKKVAVVESEKTAVIAAHFLPEYVWLAAGGSNGLSHEKCQVLRNRHVTLFPDLDKHSEWKIKATEFGFGVSEYIQQIATPEQKKQGLDIADFLLDQK